MVPPRRLRFASSVAAATWCALVLLGALPMNTAITAPRANWIVEENAKPGTSAWRIPNGVPHDIQGYADRTSALPDQRVRLYVDTSASSFRVQLFRLGWYEGDGGRRVWTSREIEGSDQPAPVILSETNTVEAQWSRSLSFRIRDGWPEGSYLAKLVDSNGGQSYVPLVIRNDASRSALVVQHQVTTWEAYNRWGGASLYLGSDGTFKTRSRVVSFDRPYAATGAGGMLKALPFIALIEKAGMDVTYWTDVDLHERPGLLQNHASLVSLNHDEYWSTRMREGAEDAREAGVNLAFFGANAIYRHIRFESSRLGSNRHIVCYKVRSEDPLNGVNNSEVTVNWRNPPLNRPESALLGAMYQCYGVHADLVVVNADVWVWAGTGLRDGDAIPGLVDGEYDRIWQDAPTPANVQILAHSPLTCRNTAGVRRHHVLHGRERRRRIRCGEHRMGRQAGVRRARPAPDLRRARRHHHHERPGRLRSRAGGCAASLLTQLAERRLRPDVADTSLGPRAVDVPRRSLKDSASPRSADSARRQRPRRGDLDVQYPSDRRTRGDVRGARRVHGDRLDHGLGAAQGRGPPSGLSSPKALTLDTNGNPVVGQGTFGPPGPGAGVRAPRTRPWNHDRAPRRRPSSGRPRRRVRRRRLGDRRRPDPLPPGHRRQRRGRAPHPQRTRRPTPIPSIRTTSRRSRTRTGWPRCPEEMPSSATRPTTTCFASRRTATSPPWPASTSRRSRPIIPTGTSHRPSPPRPCRRR